MTADDVIATFNYHRDENSKSAAKGLLSAIKEIKKDGDNRVIFELDGGNADFPYIVSDYHIMIMPSVDGAITDAEQPGRYRRVHRRELRARCADPDEAQSELLQGRPGSFR
jgi:ABC-type transport system substrate-binding protein